MTRPPPIVAPEREKPGMSASACAAPTKNACRKPTRDRRIHPNEGFAARWDLIDSTARKRRRSGTWLFLMHPQEEGSRPGRRPPRAESGVPVVRLRCVRRAMVSLQAPF